MVSFHSQKLRTAIAGTLLFLGTFALFSRALPYGFTNYDDTFYITENAHVQGGLSWESIHWAFTGATDYWHPLTWLSHMIDWELYRENATGHRATSLLWHAANAVLGFLVLRRMTGTFWTSLLCAAFFAWHPLRVESVVWMPERKDVMSGCFFLLMLWAYTAYAGKRSPGTSKPARRLYGWALAAFAAGLMCKPIMVAAPIVLLLLDVWPLKRIEFGDGRFFQRARALVLEKTPFFVGSVAIAIVTIVMQVKIGAFTISVSFVDRVWNAFISIVRYLGFLFFPFDLAVIYPHPGSWPILVALSSTVLVVSLTGIIWLQRKSHPWVLVGWVWFLAMLFPVLGLVQVGVQSMADRYTYIPSIGIGIAVAWTLRSLAVDQRTSRILAGFSVAALIGLALRTWDQEQFWHDSPTLFAHAAAVTENNFAAQTYYAMTVLTHGDVDEAERHVQAALKINPEFTAAIEVLAMTRAAQGRLAEAEAGFRRVLERRPNPGWTYNSLGKVLLRAEKLDDAESAFLSALKEKPELLEAHWNLARIEMKRGNWKQAIARLRLADDGSPENAVGWVTLGDNLAKSRRYNEAAESYERAAQLSPLDPQIHARLGYLKMVMDRPDEALAHWETALRLNPQFPGLRERIESIESAPR